MYTDKNGKHWYKGNLHTHTTDSDGKRTPVEAMALYRENGYDFLALTDHWRVSLPEEADGLLLLGGCEYNIGKAARTGVVHIVGVGMTRVPGCSEQDEPQTIIDKIHNAGGFAVWAHPAWSLNPPELIARYHGIDASEIYNSVSGFPRNVRPDSSLILDMLATNGRPLPLVAADDTHFYEADACRSYVWVQAEACTREEILAALRDGRFYASQGPQIDARRDGDRIVVETTPAASIAFFSDSPWVNERVFLGENLTGAAYTVQPKDTFVRAEITDADGNKAWTQYFTV